MTAYERGQLLRWRLCHENSAIAAPAEMAISFGVESALLRDILSREKMGGDAILFVDGNTMAWPSRD